MSQGNNAYIEGPFAWDDTLGRYDTTNKLTCIDGSETAQKVAWRVADSSSRRNNLPVGTSIDLDLDDVEAKSLSGSGTVASVHPAPVWPVWSALPNNTAKPSAQKKYEYLNTRGHFIVASLIRSQEISSFTGLGSAALKVKTVNGPEITSGFIDVDLTGQAALLFKGGIPQSSVDVTNSTDTYTVKIKNKCSQGLPENATLLIGLSNGKLNAITVGGGADTVLSSDAASASVSIADSTQTVIVNLTIESDNTSDGLTNALKVSYQVPDGSDFKLYNLNDFTIKD
jgi:hypothetical protein